MIGIIHFLTSQFGNIVKILDTPFFNDIPITYFDMLITGVVIGAIVMLLKGGFIEFNAYTNSIFSKGIKKNYNMSNNQRKEEIVNNSYEPKHIHNPKLVYRPKHLSND